MSPEVSLAIIASCFVLLFVCAIIITIVLYRLLTKINLMIEWDVEPFVQNAREISESVKKATSSFCKCAFSSNRETNGHEYRRKLNNNNWTEWVDLGILLWQKLKQRIEK